MSCPKCGSEHTQVKGSSETYDYYLCSDCGNVYTVKK